MRVDDYVSEYSRAIKDFTGYIVSCTALCVPQCRSSRNSARFIEPQGPSYYICALLSGSKLVPRLGSLKDSALEYFYILSFARGPLSLSCQEVLQQHSGLGDLSISLTIIAPQAFKFRLVSIVISMLSVEYAWRAAEPKPLMLTLQWPVSLADGSFSSTF